MLRNTFKLLGNNFVVVWKQLLYMFIISLITVGLSALLALPVINLVRSTGWFGDFDEFISLFYTNPSMVAEGFRILSTDLWRLLFDNIAGYWLNYILILVILLFLIKMFFSISYYSIGCLIDGKMSAFASYSYTNKLVSNLRENISYSFFNYLCSIPFFFLYLLFGYIYGKLANNLISAVVMLPLLAMVFVVIRSVKITLLAGMLPAMISDGVKGSSAASVGFRRTIPKFWKTFSSSLVLVLVEFVLVLVFGIFTLGVGLVVVLPLIPVLETIFSFIVYYTSTKKRYYLNENLIVNPL